MSAVLKSPPIAALRARHFAPLVGDRFKLALEDETLELRLEEAEACGEAQPGLDRGPFSLLFAGPASPVLPQSMYSLDHASFGQLDLFLVPISSDGEQARYEAIFT